MNRPDLGLRGAGPGDELIAHLTPVLYPEGNLDERIGVPAAGSGSAGLPPSGLAPVGPRGRDLEPECPGGPGPAEPEGASPWSGSVLVDRSGLAAGGSILDRAGVVDRSGMPRPGGPDRPEPGAGPGSGGAAGPGPETADARGADNGRPAGEGRTARHAALSGGYAPVTARIPDREADDDQDVVDVTGGSDPLRLPDVDPELSTATSELSTLSGRMPAAGDYPPPRPARSVLLHSGPLPPGMVPPVPGSGGESDPSASSSPGGNPEAGPDEQGGPDADRPVRIGPGFGDVFPTDPLAERSTAPNPSGGGRDHPTPADPGPQPAPAPVPTLWLTPAPLGTSSGTGASPGSTPGTGTTSGAGTTPGPGAGPGASAASAASAGSAARGFPGPGTSGSASGSSSAPMSSSAVSGDPRPSGEPSAASAAPTGTAAARTSPAARISPEDAEELLRLFEAQATSRWLDVAARRLRARGEGHYTIGSAGHETNAAVALATRPTDPALLHYRSGAFYLARAAQAGHVDAIRDIALGLVGSSEEPIAGGRHKVFGHPDLSVIPQTSTIASHLPRAVGVAWAIGRQQGLPARLRRPLRWPDDALVVASFGDASANHSTATGAINAACWAAYQGTPLPLLLVCEDNGLGISVRTPQGWVAEQFGHRRSLEYRYDDGSNPLVTLGVARAAAEYARSRQVPVLLHLRCVRIGGHAGSDVESAYRTPAEIAADLNGDPLGATMRTLLRGGVLTDEQLRRRWLEIRDEVAGTVSQAVRRPRLQTVGEVMAPLAPRRPAVVADRAAWFGDETERQRVFGGKLPEDEGPLTLAQTINRTLLDAGAAAPHLVVLGQDVARKGGIYGVTRGLQRKLGASRVLDTLLDEQSVLGMALGAGLAGLLPVPEIQYLAYLHNAEDQLRGEAATLQFFSRGAYRNPLVVRVAGLAYQQGMGGHFHNDNGLSVLRDVPGLVVACPAHPSDAPSLLRTCLAAAEVDGTVSVLLEPIALYHERDMVERGDNAWLARYSPPSSWPAHHAPIGRAATWGTGQDLTIASFGNGLRMSLQAASRLAAEGVGCRVVDLRWLQPLPIGDVLREARATGRLLVVDETRRTGGISEGLITGLLEAGFGGRIARVAAEDSFVPMGDAAELVLVSREDVEAAARLMLG